MKEEKNNSKLLKFTMRRRQLITGLIFISPFLVGFTLFVLYPIIQSIVFSLGKIEVTPDGYNLKTVGFYNYNYSLFSHSKYIRTFVESMGEVLMELPVIMIFSFFAANLLNQKFKGRFVARAIFFLPVILSAGALQLLEHGGGIGGWGIDTMQESMSYGARTVGMFNSQSLTNFMTQLKLPQGFIDYILNALNNIPEIINSSGIPILIFLAALQSIPTSLFESADIEGATGWEKFWKITFPLVSPLILTNVVYIIIESFTRETNFLMRLIRDTAWDGEGFGVSAAMSWMYFIVVFIFLAIVYKLLAKRTHYMD